MTVRPIAGETFLSAKEYPVITVVGPRQSGMTTLVKMIFPEHVYISLEQLENRQLAVSDPKTFL